MYFFLAFQSPFQPRRHLAFCTAWTAEAVIKVRQMQTLHIYIMNSSKPNENKHENRIHCLSSEALKLSHVPSYVLHLLPVIVFSTAGVGIMFYVDVLID